MTDQKTANTPVPAESTGSKPEGEERSASPSPPEAVERLPTPVLEAEVPPAPESDAVEDASPTESAAADRVTESASSGSTPSDSTPTTAISAEGSAAASKLNPWQAIFSPQYNAYYFFNSETQETTWTNPLQPDAPSSDPSASTSPVASSSALPGTSTSTITVEESSSTSTSTSTSTHDPTAHYAALQNAALAAGIDPALAYLDPTLASSLPSSSVPTGPGGLPSFQAKFNARTGAFTRVDARDPSHLSEFERAKRMSEFYFDVEGWEKQLAAQGGSIRGSADGEEYDETGKKRKRPTKKDLERFKEQKKQKKIAKTAWLRT
ncbi:hypothetical protein BDQ12DRAFT_739206 [Crucibulum laeve]|uniref:WW domain-containing protein n=1 Tax=Crucibulum laeve TaxID=68775 RepID=A0A5C3LLC6_9AGAR|nr:hypothetical protein BDQ12DRAFT_739206 [Crucibulum laeve]